MHLSAAPCDDQSPVEAGREGACRITRSHFQASAGREDFAVGHRCVFVNQHLRTRRRGPLHPRTRHGRIVRIRLAVECERDIPALHAATAHAHDQIAPARRSIGRYSDRWLRDADVGDEPITRAFGRENEQVAASGAAHRLRPTKDTSISGLPSPFRSTELSKYRSSPALNILRIEFAMSAGSADWAMTCETPLARQATTARRMMARREGIVTIMRNS